MRAFMFLFGFWIGFVVQIGIKAFWLNADSSMNVAFLAFWPLVVAGVLFFLPFYVWLRKREKYK